MIFQVSEFNEFINIYLQSVGEVVVEGEISEIKISQNKWIFATVKDDKSSLSVFSIVYKISGYDLLEPGMLVHVYGTPRLYTKDGRFSIFAQKIIPAGEGALRLAFEKLKAKLEKEGLFDIERKRKLPLFPEKIGLITAKGSQAYKDFTKVLENRMGGLKIYFHPVAVQGKFSADSIVSALQLLNTKYQDLDLMVITRGGGSLEDLQSLNDEKVARAIFSSRMPVVSAVGHEGDVTISDLVCDLRASTPSNAAELIVKDRREVLKDINFSVMTLKNYLERLLNEKNRQVLSYVFILKNAIYKKTAKLHNTIAKFNTQFEVFRKHIETFATSAKSTKHRLKTNVFFWLKRHKDSLEALTRLLKSLDYKEVLNRGYSITYGKNGKIIKSAKDISIGEIIKTTIRYGKIISAVSSLSNKNS